MRRKPRFINSAPPDDEALLRNMKQLRCCSVMKHSASASYDKRNERMGCSGLPPSASSGPGFFARRAKT